MATIWKPGLPLIRLNRFDEAQDVIEGALAQKLDGTSYHTQLNQIALVRGDEDPDIGPA